MADETHTETCPCARQVVGGFIESGSPEECAALKAVALKRPEAGEVAALAAQGIQFAMAKM